MEVWAAEAAICSAKPNDVEVVARYAGKVPRRDECTKAKGQVAAPGFSHLSVVVVR